MSSTINVTIVKMLALKSGNRCAAPGCIQKLMVEGNNIKGGTIVGEIAHIIGEKKGAERHDASMTAEQLNSYENLIFLCPTHHTQIDKPGNTYTVDILREWKRDHEARIDQAIMDSMPDVTFAELEIVAKAIADGVAKPFDGDFRITDPTEKMKRNGMTKRSQNMLTMGLAASREVREFIAAVSITIPFFEDRLRSGFQAQYDKLCGEGLRGDDLFDSLCAFASKYSLDVRVQAASLAVVAHLFESCDVFKR